MLSTSYNVSRAWLSLRVWKASTDPSPSSEAIDQASMVFPVPASPVTSSGCSTASAVLTAVTSFGAAR
jgi:hypothetical protein